MEQNELKHYGVLGMRWGIRRTQDQLSRGKKGSSEQEPEHEDYTKPRSKSLKSMSNEELRKSIDRLNIEKQYNQLTKKEISAGRKWITSVLTEASKDTAKNYVSKMMTKGADVLIELIKSALKKKGNSD